MNNSARRCQSDRKSVMTVIPFHGSTYTRSVEEPLVPPFQTEAHCLGPDRHEIGEIREENTAFPLADGRLVDAGNQSKLILPETKNILSDVFEGIHEANIFLQACHVNMLVRICFMRAGML